MVNNEIWIDIKTVASIKNVTSRAIRLSFSKDKYIFREAKQQGGKSYEILLSSLEQRVQDIYKHTYYREIIEAVNHDLMVPVTTSVETETGFIPETAKTIALARVDLVLEWQKFRNKHNPKNKGDELFIDLYNSGEYFRRNNYDKWVLMREGEKALNDKVLPCLRRDISKIEVGQVLVADGHTLNFLVLNSFTGRPCRASLVGFLDWKSGYLCGYEIMLEENTQCIASALRMSIISLDMIPDIVYQDNGKAFRAKYFSKCSDFTEAGFNGIYTNLGIKPVYAKPYNARAKVIERFFKEFQEEFEKLLPTYIGSSIKNKPAHLKRNEKFHKELYDKVNQGYIPTIEETIGFINSWLNYRHSQPCPNDRSRSIKEVFESRNKENIDINKLDELMMAHEVKTVNRNGIRFLNTDYNSDSLYGLRDRVMIRYSLFDLSKIKVYSTRGEFICTAKRVTLTHPMAYHLGEVKDQEDFIRKIKKPQQLRNKTLRTIKKYLPKEDIKFLEAQMIEDSMSQETPEPRTEIVPIIMPEKLRPIFINNYEKYEYLMKEGCISPEERRWLMEYKQSEEYKLIYEE